MVDLGCQIVPPQRDAEQELHPGHDPVAIADAETALDQVQLKAANVVGGGRVGRALQERRKPPAAVDVAALRMGPQLACPHVLDHALTQLANGGIGTHWEFLPLRGSRRLKSGGDSPSRYQLSFAPTAAPGPRPLFCAA